MSEIFKEYFVRLDGYLKNHDLTYDEIYHLYHCDLLENCKTFFLNKSGMTGFSEGFISRLFFHLLKCNPEPEQNEGRETFGFYNKKKYHLWCGTEIQGDDSKISKIKPDISIWSPDGEIVVLVEVKTYLVGGAQDIDKLIQRFQKVKKVHKNLRALLICYASNEKAKEKLLSFAKTNPWFNYVSLFGNELDAKKNLCSLLGLKEFV